MPIPEEYGSLNIWYNQIVGNLGSLNSEFSVFSKYWNHFTSQQKTDIKNLICAGIDEGITQLNLIKAEIQSIDS